MQILIAFVRVVDGLNDRTGRFVSWLTLAMVLICAAVVFLRYVMNVGFIWMQELYVWCHAIVFMVGAGYTFLYGGHVRVDIFYSRASLRTKAWIDLLGTPVFLLPWLVVVAWTGLPYILASWAISEPSSQTGGMPAIYLLKSIILLFCLLVALQGLALMARSALVLSGREEFGQVPGGGH